MLLASAIATSLSAAAYDFEWAGIYYNITGDNTVEVTRSDNYNNTYSGSISVPDVLTNYRGYFVTKIGENAFAGSAVTSVSMPEGITSIGQYAFSGCQNLESVTLPESLTTLGSEAFMLCKSLKTIKIPSGVTAIPDCCFNHCLSLESVTIPEGVTTIGDGAFVGCNLKELTLPSTVTMIESGAFLSNNRCQSITCNATTPPNLGENVFGYNASTTVKVPLQSIAAYRQAEGWKNFTNYYGGEVIADGITYRIDENDAMVAAAEATLTEANIPSSVEFEGNQYPVIKINDEVFSGNTNLTSVTLPESLTTLGDRAFWSCTNLESVKIPNTVTSIKHSAFQYCCNLESIIIPSSVNSIGISAFSECKALKDIYCQAVNVPETHSSAFNNSPIENMTLYVPGESMNAYKTTDPWSGFGKFQTLTTGIEKTETAAKPMITTADGQIAVSGLSGNATIQVLSLDGKLLDSTNATDGIATLNAQPGEVVIVKVGTESYKVVVR